MSFSLVNLKELANGRRSSATGYCGEILPSEAWQFLKENQGFLVDVRTSAEWKFVGVANLEDGAKSLFIEWLKYPDFSANQNFASDLTDKINDKSAPIFFICKTGGRSSQAANLATQIGYENCFNVINGFEGDANEHQQRGKINGWRAEGLPWKQQ